MQTYLITSAQSDLSRLAHLAAQGQEVLLKENDQPLAKLVPLDEGDAAYRRDVRSLISLAKSMRPFDPENESEREYSAEEVEAYRDRVRALRGILKGIDTTVERDEDRV